jgi:hypothetical protein
MIISLKHHFTFLCMPKSGSTATERALREYAQLMTDADPRLKHVNYRQYCRFVLPLLKRKLRRGGSSVPEVVCLFREPISWLNSWYRYRKRSSLVEGQSSEQSRHTANVSFYEFAEEYISAAPRPFAQIGHQSAFIETGWGEIGNIVLFQYERYDLFLDYMSRKVGRPVKVDRANESPVDEEPYDLGRLDFLKKPLEKEYRYYQLIGERQLSHAAKPALPISRPAHLI